MSSDKDFLSRMRECGISPETLAYFEDPQLEMPDETPKEPVLPSEYQQNGSEHITIRYGSNGHLQKEFSIQLPADDNTIREFKQQLSELGVPEKEIDFILTHNNLTEMIGSQLRIARETIDHMMDDFLGAPNQDGTPKRRRRQRS